MRKQRKIIKPLPEPSVLLVSLSREDQESVAKKLFKMWLDRLGLAHYYVQLIFVDKNDEHDEPESFTAGVTVAHPKTLTGIVSISNHFLSQDFLTVQELSNLIGHELTHLLIREHLLGPVEELLNMVRVKDEVKGSYMQRIEDGMERMCRSLERGVYDEVYV